MIADEQLREILAEHRELTRRMMLLEFRLATVLNTGPSAQVEPVADSSGTMPWLRQAKLFTSGDTGAESSLTWGSFFLDDG